ncbi:ATP-binding cassette domain-containing protein, partial [Mycobacterium tuberculosis]|nr:ATP-binding cassette domain-containing protein [Mycobacterium tuberculosis]
CSPTLRMVLILSLRSPGSSTISAENMFLGNEVADGGVIDWYQTTARAREFMAKVGLKESPLALITNIGVGKQQLVEIAKALAKKVKLLILD